ncbi:hypothetical protein EV683_1177 [Crenobacter luteus]|uniref:hypothetical protein n=1 Tax=Crenobacter luteus TaxID=1452487 RepID=UPI00104AEB26|nr:hypothetical protein [Crenobacter luteus]TCP10890.1 hypothetical protein EV683_1177 [Crenobacter luteus]
MLNPNALHLAERDGQLAALRALYALRWHLDAHDTGDDAQRAATAFCEGFADVFAPLLAEAREADGHPAAALFRLIAARAPELIVSLER